MPVGKSPGLLPRLAAAAAILIDLGPARPQVVFICSQKKPCRRNGWRIIRVVVPGTISAAENLLISEELIRTFEYRAKDF